MLFPQSRRALEYGKNDTPVTSPDYDLAAEREKVRAANAAMPREDVAEVLDLDADGVRCRLYRPAQDPAASDLIVHLHGGGFALNDIDVHDAAARRLANRSQMAVLSVDYAKPPEHRFPAAPDSVDTALAWLRDRAGEYGLEGAWAVHGDSAGANLALVAALRNPDRFAAVALIYPFLDPSCSFLSYATAGGGLDEATARWFWTTYATPADFADPDLAPLLSPRLGTLPPTLVVTAEHDPLRDEGEFLARRLAELGVEVTANRYLGMIHGFWRHAHVFDTAEPLMRQVAGFLRWQVERPAD